MGYFDHYGSESSTAVGDFLVFKKVLCQFEFLMKYAKGISKETHILEIGPGKGDLARFFLNNGFVNYDIVEPNDLMRRKLESMPFRRVDGYLIPWLKAEDASYDLVIVSDVFEHLNDADDGMKFIGEVSRVLRNGGYFLLISPDLRDWQFDFWNCDFSHSNPTTLRRAKELIFNHDMTCVAHRYTYSCFTGFIGYAISRMIKLLTFGFSGDHINCKIYKLRLSFLRRFILLGKK